MALWTFRDYTDESGGNVIADWIKAIKPPKKRTKVVARWDAFLEFMENREEFGWPRAWFTELEGYSGIFEMKFTVQNIQWRPLGYFGPRPHEFTFLIGAIEKNDRFVPLNAPATALTRRAVIAADFRRAVEHDPPGEDDE